MSLKKFYKEKSTLELMNKLKIENKLDLPRLEKVIVSIGLSEARFDKNETLTRIKTLSAITGQKPQALKAKKAISNFKIRLGQTIAYMVTLRGKRMYDFVDKLINIVLPRIRDFRGIPSYSIDNNGNLSIGIKEHIAFPEIKMEEVEKLHGLGITIVTTAKDREEAKALMRALGAVVSDEKRKKEVETLEKMQETREKKNKESETKVEKIEEVK
ncbi:MAG: 50S ribosomal protein L5 [Candidatus Berkelbacteria bacterium]|nr:50S ribosomal protein L5 [Candidatus Berkelbacteria bacterium]